MKDEYDIRNLNPRKNPYAKAKKQQGAIITCEVTNVNRDPFEEYLIASEPDKREKGYAWHTAIGLQAVDGLKTSEYLRSTAVRNIEGEISFEEANALLRSYYEENPSRDSDDRTEEADKVSARIAELLSERAFSFTPNEYISIHRKLFTGIYSHAGRIRDYNITKKEWVLDGATVLYGSATELRATLEYDFSEERKFSYKGLSMDEMIRHLAVFVSRLWQNNVFGEGKRRPSGTGTGGGVLVHFANCRAARYIRGCHEAPLQSGDGCSA